MAKVLIIDDSRLSTSALSNMLQELGHQILDTAFSGEEGIQKAKSTSPEVVCLDMIMPGIDGTETAMKLPKSAKVIMITQKEIDDATKAKINAVSYIVKPITRAKLEDAFSKL